MSQNLFWGKFFYFPSNKPYFAVIVKIKYGTYRYWSMWTNHFGNTLKDVGEKVKKSSPSTKEKCLFSNTFSCAPSASYKKTIFIRNKHLLMISRLEKAQFED